MYAVNGMTNQAVTEVDKPLTLHLAGSAEAGMYGAAARIATTLSLPISSVIQSQSHRLFGYGPAMNTGHADFLWRYGGTFALYGIAGALCYRY
ncbi:MAG: hypothetical protein IPF57_25325 [Gammaproteobacteria bacterium]|nr:hypothetical protein [Gammaproteobacteria bacterium]